MTYSREFTPNNIEQLAEGEIFVFGSNLAGMHGGGAARAARLKFGAIMGQGVGLQGRSYAIPTMQGGVETVKPYVDEFIQFARQHPELRFLVTRIGCGIAGFRDEEIAPLFSDAIGVENIILPRSFVETSIFTPLPCPANVRCMGAICGDVVGSPYEFHPVKHKAFSLFVRNSYPTDDSIMTMANMRWLCDGGQNSLVGRMHEWGQRYPGGGYGGRFCHWLQSGSTEPYGSFGNGSAMRVSPVAWAADSLGEALELARRSAEVTHNHPEGVKGAQAVAAAIFMARQGSSKSDIKTYVEQQFGYNLSRSVDEIRATYEFDETCQKSVPESIICFLEATDFEDSIRNAVSLGGDADTQAAIAGSIAEAFWGIPDELLAQVWGRLDAFQQQTLIDFQSVVKELSV